MLITVELLQKYNACSKGLEYFEKRYPNGITIEELSKNKIPMHYVLWAYNTLPKTEEDRKLFIKYLELNSCTSWYNCYKCKNSHFIKESRHIYDSMNVSNSNQVTNSMAIYNSEEVNNSSVVYFSEYVEDSKIINESHNITDSYNIFKTVYADKSNNCINCYNITNSDYCEDSKNLQDCHFVRNCENASHLMFCVDLFNTNQNKYYIFNSEITEEQFNNIKKQFNKFVEFDLDFTKDPIPDISEICAPPPTTNYIYYDHYKNITGRFKKWVKTLPYYNSEIMYYITFIDEYLECKN